MEWKECRISASTLQKRDRKEVGNCVCNVVGTNNEYKYGTKIPLVGEWVIDNQKGERRKRPPSKER